MKNEKKLNVTYGHATYSIPLGDIIYMEKELRKIRLHARRGDLVFYGRFAELVPQLDDRFCYCHKSYILNMDEIVCAAAGNIIMSDESVLAFGKNLYGNFRKKYRKYLIEQSRKNT